MKYYALTTLLVGLITASSALANRADVDLDDDGLIEISSLHEFNRMRYHPQGTHYNESNKGCPSTGCFGFELTQDLDFDSDGDGDLSDEAFWNDGLGWEPIDEFSGVLEGNGHEIRNLMINRPAELIIGLFKTLYGEVRNLQLTGDLMSVRAGGSVGALAGYTSSATVSNVTSTGLVTGGRGGIGGLIGFGLYEDKILNCSTTGNVVFDRDIPDRSPSVPREELTYVGGLIGETRTSHIEGSFALGNIFGGRHVGGLVGSSYGTEIIASFATGTVEGTDEVGGLVGQMRPIPWGERIVAARIIASYATGGVIGTSQVGSLLGSMETLPVEELFLLIYLPSEEDIAALVPQVRQSYATGAVVINGVQTAALVGEPDGSIENSHWALDPLGTVLPELFPGLGGSGATLAQLRCPTGPNNTTCADTVLYEGWDLAVDSAGQPIWQFGSPSDLPFIRVAVQPAWMNTDGPSGEGDNETIERIQSRDPYYPCLDDPEAVLEAQIPGRAIVYRTDYPAVLEFFNIHEGLGCRDTQQPNGAGCPDFEVGYLCSGEWTAYHDRDNPSGEGDYEHASKSPVRCSNPTEIRARVKGQEQVYYGTPDKLALFSAAEGLQCLKNDQQALGSSGCQNYSVRLSCPQRSFH